MAKVLSDSVLVGDRQTRLGTTRLFLLLILSSSLLLLSLLTSWEQLAVLPGCLYLPVAPGLPGVSR